MHLAEFDLQLDLKDMKHRAQPLYEERQTQKATDEYSDSQAAIVPHIHCVVAWYDRVNHSTKTRTAAAAAAASTSKHQQHQQQQHSS